MWPVAESIVRQFRSLATPEENNAYTVSDAVLTPALRGEADEII